MYKKLFFVNHKQNYINIYRRLYLNYYNNTQYHRIQFVEILYCINIKYCTLSNTKTPKGNTISFRKKSCEYH